MERISSIALPFFKVTDTPHLPELGSIVIHHWACTGDLPHLKQTAEDSGVDSLLITDYYGNTVLHYAASSKSYNVAKYIVSLFPNNHFFNSMHITPAHIAAQRNDVKMLEILKENTVLIKSCSYKNWEPVHFAIFYGNYEAVKYLLDNDLVNLSSLILGVEACKDNFIILNSFKFMSLLDLALYSKNEQIINLLNEKNALPSLHTAVKNNDLQAITFHLFGDKKDVNEVSNYKKSTPLHIAAYMGNYEVAHCLIESNACPDLLNEDGFSPLELAVISDSLETVYVLLEKTSLDLCAKALFLATDLQRINIINVLSCTDFSKSYVADNGDTILIRFIKRKLFTIAENYIKLRKPDIQQKDANGAIALHYAAVSSSKSLINALITNENKNAQDNKGRTPLFYAVMASDTESIIELLNNNCSVDIMTTYGISPVAIALSLELSNRLTLTQQSALIRYTINIKDIINMFEKKSNKIILPDYINNTVVEYEYQEIQLYGPQFIRARKSASANLYIQKTDGILHGGTIIHLATIFEARSGGFQQIIMKFKELIEMTDDLGCSPIQLAAMLERANIISLLLKANANIMTKDNNGNTLFHYIDQVGIYERLKDVITNTSLSPIEFNNDNDTPIHFACKYGSQSLLKLYTSLITDLSYLNIPNKKGMTPIDIAIENKNIDCIRFLNAQGVPNILVETTRNNDFEKMRYLIENVGYPVNTCDKSCITPLHEAVSVQSIKMIKYLLEHDADINAKTLNGYLPIHYAAINNNLEICLLLFKENFDITIIHSSDQPFLLSSDQMCHDFLYHYWKRQLICNFFISFMKSTNQLLSSFSSSLTKINIYFSKNKKINNIVSNLLQLYDKLLFISNQILNRSTKSKYSYNYGTSLHHLLHILTTINIEPYSSLYEFNVVELIEEIAKQKTQKFIDLNFYPLVWIHFVYKIISLIEKHLLIKPEIDNKSLFTQILKEKLKTQSEKSVKYLENLTIPKDDDFPFKNIPGYIVVHCDGIINEIQNEPQCIFRPQFFVDLKLFFGDKFVLPRMVPFNNKDQIRVYIYDEYFAIHNKDYSFAIPLVLINAKQMSNESDFQIVTPAGTFRINFNSHSLLPLIKGTLENASILLHGFNHGEFQIQSENIDYYKCLVIYQISGKRNILLHVMIIKANNKAQCYDICYAYLKDSLPSPPVFFNVISLKINFPHNITFIE